MALHPGSRIGPYEIVAPLGAGGMGEVYRASDTVLKRHIALKILPEDVAGNPERVARFQREAELLAALNHPNIAHLYGIERSAGVFALVMELVDGPTLADRIALGPIPLAEALPIAGQIAAALEAAHERGIIHRDLKPSNIKVRADGTVKVLDFGLAKAMEPSGSSGPMTESPTLTSPAMTRRGVILGTAAYMSPEQAAGRAADVRSDLWAFGVVLLEMLTGQPVFVGETVSHVLAAILRDTPSFDRLPSDTPSTIRTLLRRCLERERGRRLASAADARLEVEDAQSAPRPTEGIRSFNFRVGLTWLTVLAVTLATLALVAAYLRRPPVESPTIRFVLAPPDGWSLGAFSVSPDGRRIAYVSGRLGVKPSLWIRRLDTIEAQQLAGTEGAVTAPFWSPDGQWLGFWAEGKLKKVDLSGGSTVTLCDVSFPTGGAWNREGTIVFADLPGRIMKVPDAGGIPTVAAELADKEMSLHGLTFLPDGRHLLYSTSVAGKNQIDIVSLESAERTVISDIPASADVQYSRGHLVFVSETRLMAQAFDVGTKTLTGEPFPIAELEGRVPSAPPGVRTAFFGTFSASENGVLAYSRIPAQSNPQLTWFDRSGRQVGVLGEPADYGDVELSPDGRQAAVTVKDPIRGTRDVWLFDVGRGLRTRFTFDQADDNLSPVWAPDGTRLVFTSTRKGHRDLYQKAAGGTDEAQPLLADDRNKTPLTWSPDGRFILFSSDGFAKEGANNLSALPTFGDRKPFVLHATPFHELQAKFSPDGRWIAYFSNEAGRDEVLVSSFPGFGDKVQVSTAGGEQPRWRRDGKEIFYLAPGGVLMAAPVTLRGGRLDVGTAQPLFSVARSRNGNAYDVGPDGQRFLVNAVDDRARAVPPTITVVANWPGGLER